MHFVDHHEAEVVAVFLKDAPALRRHREALVGAERCDRKEVVPLLQHADKLLLEAVLQLRDVGEGSDRLFELVAEVFEMRQHQGPLFQLAHQCRHDDGLAAARWALDHTVTVLDPFAQQALLLIVQLARELQRHRQGRDPTEVIRFNVAEDPLDLRLVATREPVVVEVFLKRLDTERKLRVWVYEVIAERTEVVRLDLLARDP